MIDPASIDLAAFLACWHGQPDQKPRPLRQDHGWLPGPLRDWHVLQSRWSKPLMRLKRMSDVEAITPADNMAVFLEEPGGDWRWAVDLRGASSVYEQECGGEWLPCNEDLPELLVHNMLEETVFNTTIWREHMTVDRDRLPQILPPMEEVGFRGWRWRPDARIFLSPTLVAQTAPNDIDPDKAQLTFEVRIAARSQSDVVHLDQMNDITWRRPGRR